jgi:hypothetical protein
VILSKSCLPTVGLPKMKSVAFRLRPVMESILPG